MCFRPGCIRLQKAKYERHSPEVRIFLKVYALWRHATASCHISVVRDCGTPVDHSPPSSSVRAGFSRQSLTGVGATALSPSHEADIWVAYSVLPGDRKLIPCGS